MIKNKMSGVAEKSVAPAFFLLEILQKTIDIYARI